MIFSGESLCVENGWALCDQNEETGRWQDGWKSHDTTTQIGQVSSSRMSNKATCTCLMIQLITGKSICTVIHGDFNPKINDVYSIQWIK